VTNLLVLSGTASAINYIHALRGVAGLRLFVTDANRYCPGLYHPWVTPIVVPRACDRAAYRAALDRIIARHGIDAMIPTSDYDIEGVVSLLDEGWDPPVRMFRPSLDQLLNLSDKGRMIDVLGKALPDHVPRTWRAPLPPLEAMRYPLVAKPIGESGGKGVSIARDAAQLASAVERLRRTHGERYVVQEYIPGNTYVLTMIYGEDGRLAVSIAMRSHLTFFTWGGGGCAGELMDAPDVHALGARIVEAAGGWKGPINMELRRHTATGVWFVFEVNCRLNGYSYLTTMNGLNLPSIAVSLLTGAELPRLEPAAPAERRNFVLGFRETAVAEWVPAGE
jgi:carbamoylphosphate synthase large subunit